MAGTDVMGFSIAWRTLHHVGLLSCTCWFQHQAIRTSVLPTWQAYKWNKVTPIEPVQGSSVSILSWSYHLFPLLFTKGKQLLAKWVSYTPINRLHVDQITSKLDHSFLVFDCVFVSEVGCIKVHTSIVHHFCKLNPVCVYICWSPGDPDRGLLHRVPALLLWWRRSNKHSWKRRHLRFPGSTAVHQRGLCTHLR